MYPLKFFTDVYTQLSHYCLLNIKRYHSKYKTGKIEYMIDPGVYELKTANEYKCIRRLRTLISRKLLKKNEFIALDYPCDMNPANTDEFITKTNYNNKKYHTYKNYIIVIQNKLYDFKSFKENFELNKPYMKGKNIIAIGNMCRLIYPTKFTDKVFKYIYDNFPEGKQIHFYGLSLRVIRKYIPKLLEKFQVSTDSTKWYRAVDRELKVKYGCNGRHHEEEFFLAYIKKLSKICEVIY